MLAVMPEKSAALNAGGIDVERSDNCEVRRIQSARVNAQHQLLKDANREHSLETHFVCFIPIV